MDNPANDIITEVAAEQNELFPVFLKLADLRMLVVGRWCGGVGKIAGAGNQFAVRADKDCGNGNQR